MRKIPLFPVLFFLAAVLPFAFFLWKAPSAMERHFKSVVSNDPQNGLSQSLGALSNAQVRLQNELYLKALKIASSAKVQTALGKTHPTFEDLKWALADNLGPSPTPVIVIADSKENALYNNIGLPVPTPSPAPTSKKKKKRPSKPLGPFYPSVKEWPGLEKALDGAPQQGAIEINGHVYWGCNLPLSSPKKNPRVLALAIPLDAAWLNQLSQACFNDLAFYSQAQTLVTCECTAPSLEPSKIVAPSNHPEKRTQLTWDGLAFLADGITLPDMDGKPFATLAVFQPVREAVTVLGTPQTDLLRLGLFCLGAMLMFLLAVSWGYSESMKQALIAIAGIKHGSASLDLPVSRFDEWGRMAKSLKELLDRFKEKERVSLILGKYMAPEVAKKIMVEKDFFALEGETKECAILAVSVRESDPLEAQLQPQIWVETLNRYFSLIHDSVARQGGLMDFFQGTQAQAVWGVPFPTEDPAPKAAQTALEIIENLLALNTERISKSQPTLELSIGLHIGQAVVGNIGSDRSFGYTVIGRTADIAKDLSLQASSRQILASEEFVQLTVGKVSALPAPSFRSETAGNLVPYEIHAKA